MYGVVYICYLLRRDYDGRGRVGLVGAFVYLDTGGWYLLSGVEEGRAVG